MDEWLYDVWSWNDTFKYWYYHGTMTTYDAAGLAEAYRLADIPLVRKVYGGRFETERLVNR